MGVKQKRVDLSLLRVPRFTVFGGGASQGAPDGVATLKIRKGAFDALNKGSGALGKVR